MRRAAWPAAALVVAALTLPIGAVRAHAAPADDSSFILGEAQGVAQAMRLVPTVGNLQATIAVGTSIAGYSDTEGKASAQNLDLGAVETALTGPQCDGSQPTFKSSDFPQPLIAESPDGKPQTAHQDITGNNSTAPADVGVLDVASTGAPNPGGKASTQGGAFSLAGLITVSGLSSGATGGVVGGNARDVTATTSVGSISLLGGLVQIGNMQEVAHQRTGAGAVNSGTFTVGSLTVAGKPMPVTPDQLASSFAAANKALAPTGFQITLPAYSKLPDGTASLTPLSIGVTNSPLGHQGVAPVLGAIEPLREQLENQLLAASCQTAQIFSNGDILLGILAGSGSLNVMFGGVTAVSDGTQYASAFGNFGYLSSSPESLDSTGGSLGTAGTLGTLGTTGGSLDGATTPTAGPATTNAAATSVIGRFCDTTHVFKHPGCVGNHALPVGIGALVLVVGLGYADAVRGRGGGLLRRRSKAALDQLKL
ncbi:MAG TPA: hypothetical protein VF288_11760 [Mycobacteriales bacterium]